MMLFGLPVLSNHWLFSLQVPQETMSLTKKNTKNNMNNSQ